ncbi:MAG: hypothetical protein Fur0023_03690 [Bacteroidia bacterium]
MSYLKIIGIALFVLFFAYAGSFFAPDFYRKYDKPMIIFLIGMYLLFYLIDFFLSKKLSPEKLVGKDLIFMTLKFLISAFYAAIQAYFIEDSRDRKDFLFHFLIYAILFLIADTIINYQIIKKNG